MREDRLDLLDHRAAAAEQGVALAFRFLVGDRLAQKVEGRPVFGVDVVLEEFVGALADMRVHVDDGVAVPGRAWLLALTLHRYAASFGTACCARLLRMREVYDAIRK